jgi:hypothetical protein
MLYTGRYTAFLSDGEAVARKFCFFREVFFFLALEMASLFKNFECAAACEVFKSACLCGASSEIRF